MQIQFSRINRYFLSALLVGLATVISSPIHLFIEPTNLVMIYLAVVVISAIYFGRGPALLASLLSVLAFDYFLIEPRYSFDVHDTQYIITFFGLLIVAMVVSSLVSQAQSQVERSRQREMETAALYSLGRDLTTAVGQDAITQIIINRVTEILSRDAIILSSSEAGLQVLASSPSYDYNETEKQAARWAYQNTHEAGRGTKHVPEAKARYLPLQTAKGVVGVLGVKPRDPSLRLSNNQYTLLLGYASLAALAMERVQLDEQASQAQVLKATEKLQSTLLNSISHDLRTPLASITGILSSLKEAEVSNGESLQLNSANRMDLMDTALGEAERLNRLVGNLLDITRLESGAIHLSLDTCDVQDLIGSVISQRMGIVKNHPIETHIPDDIPLVCGDFVLLNQVLINLLDNAIKYSPSGKPITIQVRPEGQNVLFAISDRGIGIPSSDLEKVFDKFYRVPRKDSVIGTGLGLSICRGIVEAHGGQIWANNRKNGGTTILFTLPADPDAGTQR